MNSNLIMSKEEWQFKRIVDLSNAISVLSGCEIKELNLIIKYLEEQRELIADIIKNFGEE